MNAVSKYEPGDSIYEIEEDMTEKKDAGLIYCRIDDSDAVWELAFDLEDACSEVLRKLNKHSTVVVNFFGNEDDDYDSSEEDLDYDDEELEESSKKKSDYHRFLESYLDSLERRQRRLR